MRHLPFSVSLSRGVTSERKVDRAAHNMHPIAEGDARLSRVDIFQIGSRLENQRRNAIHVVETYPNDWIVIHETLQNSLDAIQKSGRDEGVVTVKMSLDHQK